jgi:hypothetical protein
MPRRTREDRSGAKTSFGMRLYVVSESTAGHSCCTSTSTSTQGTLYIRTSILADLCRLAKPHHLNDLLCRYCGLNNTVMLRRTMACRYHDPACIHTSVEPPATLNRLLTCCTFKGPRETSWYAAHRIHIAFNASQSHQSSRLCLGLNSKAGYGRDGMVCRQLGEMSNRHYGYAGHHPKHHTSSAPVLHL